MFIINENISLNNITAFFADHAFGGETSFSDCC
jgi:hypothetical protein